MLLDCFLSEYYSFVHRFKQKPSPPWTAIAASAGILVITLLLGHIFHAAINRITEVEGQYQEMMELKHRAQAADIAKSQVRFTPIMQVSKTSDEPQFYFYHLIIEL